MFDKQAAKINLLKERVVEVKKKLATKKEERKANEVLLVHKEEELEKAQTKVEQLGGELTRLYEEVQSLRSQLEQVMVTVAKAVSSFKPRRKLL